MSRLLSTWKWMAVASLAGFTPEYASEQVHDRGLDTALVEIYDPETNLVTWMTLPTAKR